ncbi:MAG: hypothetical protein JOZ94_26485 [Xanthobacteraceae bacterium]|nr:hypothetical protein [Xanthobacteraceae bacterium]MBV9629601.1 hypothetical protein [Xanthobacteraceae bacterium]
MASLAIHPPVHLTLHPDEPIRTVEDAIKVVLRHARDAESQETQRLVAALNHAQSQEQADQVAVLFRDWAQAEGLLLVPPEDRRTVG